MKKTTQAYLPQELLFEIFKRLPLKSLLRIRSVSKSWRSLISNPQFITLHRDYNNNNTHMLANVNGAVHWIAHNPTKIGGFRSLIVAFDLNDEVFKEMRLPNELAQEYPVAMSIAACGELLSLFHYYQSSSSNRGCSVWVMEKYGIDHSWTKLFNIELLQGVDLVLGSRKNGEFLVVTKDEKLVSYDPDDEQFKDLGICRTCSFVLRACSLYVSPYIESLILVDSSNGGLGNDSAPDLLGEDDSEIKDRQ
ncbi:F-box/kelch-repeat protein At3g06240-like isoform X3 [Diospyros lotus]|uniref:F-box/kelch-repeat protein At3g06240-like isoform X3 n=1 Tax=Diospyros lotus TaxID=55363 RepID=UPI00224E634A|nr:F-box/kelch-repeat protein At3g06240-like isoform X3 [Diospyros lotus]